jgi:hypothetical protein
VGFGIEPRQDVPGERPYVKPAPDITGTLTTRDPVENAYHVAIDNWSPLAECEATDGGSNIKAYMRQ